MRLHKNKYMSAFAIAALAAGLSVAYASDSPSLVANIHASITHDALGQTLSAANLKAVIDADVSQDAPGEDGAAEKRRHFDGSAMAAAVAYINREKNTALNLAAEADTDDKSRADALRHIGLMLHSVQDFYLHSNYVELMLEQPENKADPYNIALVDWSKVPDGYVGKQSGSHLNGYDSKDVDDPLNKESATAAGGKLVIADKVTQHSVAVDLAERETQRQWNLFETLVRARCGARAAAVLAALKQAPPAVEGSRQEASTNPAN